MKKIIAIMFCALAISALAQTPVKVNPALVPATGNFYLLSQGDMPMPPMPFDPFPGLQVYSLGEDRYVIDDRAVAAAKEALSEEQAASGSRTMSADDDGP